MKQLILAAALLFTSVSQAEVFAYTSNDNGGRINLTNEKGKCPADQLIAFAYGKNNTVVRGCWWFENNYVWIRYSDGDMRVYDPTIFYVLKQNKKEM